MKAGADVRQDVIGELDWDPQAPDPDAISVTVQDGAVTLGGEPVLITGDKGSPRLCQSRRHAALLPPSASEVRRRWPECLE